MRATAGGRVIVLRPGEFRLFALLLAQAGYTVTRDRILDALWQDEWDIDPRCVDVVICRIRSALRPFGLSKRIETVRGVGYRLRAG